MDNIINETLALIDENHHSSATPYNTPLGWKTEVLERAKRSADILGLSRSPKWFDPLLEDAAHLWHTNASYCLINFELRKPRRAKTIDLILCIDNLSLENLALNAHAVISQPMQYYLFGYYPWADDVPIDNLYIDHSLGETKFIPSRELALMWTNGIEQYVKESKSSDEIYSHADIPSEDVARNEFAAKFQRMFATIGNLQRRGDMEFGTISDGCQFSLGIQHAVLDRFHVKPHKHSSFLYLLHMEVMKYLSGGGQIKGKWGHLAFLDGKLILECRPIEELLD